MSKDTFPTLRSNTEKRKQYLEILERELKEVSVTQVGKAYGDGKGGISIGQPQSLESLQEWARKGRMAVMINIRKKEIYIGDDHRGMGDSQNIPEEDLLAGITRFNNEKNVIEMEYLGDRRTHGSRATSDSSEVKEEGPRAIVAGKIQEFVFPVLD